MSLDAGQTPAVLDMRWADKAWTDAHTVAQVVCLSPPRKSHFRTNYHRLNMFTADGRQPVGGIPVFERGRVVRGLGGASAGTWITRP